MMFTSSSWVFWRIFLSSADIGSSSSNSFGRFTSERANATRCCWPPESWCGLRFAYLLICTSASASATRALISCFGVPSCFRPNATFDSTVMCGNSAYDWNIMFTGRRYGGSDARSSPSTKILPEVAVSRPASMRSNVDLPQPELPSSANSSFFAIVRFTLSTAVLSPNFFTTFSMRTKAPASRRTSAATGAAGSVWIIVVSLNRPTSAAATDGSASARCRRCAASRATSSRSWRRTGRCSGPARSPASRTGARPCSRWGSRSRS
ncbi:hypothetical protein BLA18109_05861 [Burkholderia lata]|uniref:Uncharacterized protein n=1 Tax=Burkholderia lata (strain ATCC 17760 / DSM 23089 / LMG 22485 / NCIMB 9086 / R18194 / 383) TaxID=482957 RepID=A0A6P2YJH9_BURL3|nr:hypothetical protein BLA18109_05861 [Burkholderia lata]